MVASSLTEVSCSDVDVGLQDVHIESISSCLKLQCSLQASISFSICFLVRLFFCTKLDDLMILYDFGFCVVLPNDTVL